jgi:hypothetical protein
LEQAATINEIRRAVQAERYVRGSIFKASEPKYFIFTWHDEEKKIAYGFHRALVPFGLNACSRAGLFEH